MGRNVNNHLSVAFKVALIICTALLSKAQAFGQGPDSIFLSGPTSFKTLTTTRLSNVIGEKQKRWIKIDDVVVETSNIALTPVEETLAKAESVEIRALLKRDTVALKRIWLRDFTLDELHSKVQHDPNPLPHYLSLNRRIEKILITGDHAYVSGIEYAVQVKEGNSVDTQVARKYTHLWIKELFGWRLATKNYD
ncbi:MAG: nuclear transport factor 2 family protein [Cyclobacteriaceae bacterium]|nr:nuclear transport factor 2 family protein [Cyclobacteriaceae bacterium]